MYKLTLILLLLLSGCSPSGTPPFNSEYELIGAYCDQTVSYEQFQYRLRESSMSTIPVSMVLALGKVDCEAYNKAMGRHINTCGYFYVDSKGLVTTQPDTLAPNTPAPGNHAVPPKAK